MQRRIFQPFNGLTATAADDAFSIDIWDGNLCAYRRVDLEDVDDPLWPAAMALAQFIDFSQMHAAA